MNLLMNFRGSQVIFGGQVGGLGANVVPVQLKTQEEPAFRFESEGREKNNVPA